MKITNEIEIDLGDPMATGASIADALVTAVLQQVSEGMTHEDRARLWCGALAAMLGGMSASIGPDDAEVIYRELDTAFDEARRIDAARGVH